MGRLGCGNRSSYCRDKIDIKELSFLTYGFNAESQLTTAGTADFTYDPAGRLYSTSVGATASLYVPSLSCHGS